MDKPASQPGAPDRAVENLNVVAPRSVEDAPQEERTDLKGIDEDEGKVMAGNPRDNYWKRLLKEKPDRHIELLMTFAITFFAAAQLITSCENNKSTSRQTDQLIAAAKYGAYASNQNALAAQSFADSARSINHGINGAVAQLGAQERDANAAAMTGEMSLRASSEQTRLDQRAWVGIAGVKTDGGVSESETFSVAGLKVLLRNSGRTPALNVSEECCKTSVQVVGGAIPDYDQELKKGEDRDKAKMKTLLQTSDKEAREHPESAETIRRLEAWALANGTTHVPTVLYRGGVIAPEVIEEVPVVNRPTHFTAVTIDPSFRPTSPKQDFPMVPATIYILGRFTYLDVFTGTALHTTKFCLMRTSGTQFSICPEGNWMN